MSLNSWVNVDKPPMLPLSMPIAPSESSFSSSYMPRHGAYTSHTGTTKRFPSRQQQSRSTRKPITGPAYLWSGEISDGTDDEVEDTKTLVRSRTATRKRFFKSYGQIN